MTKIYHEEKFQQRDLYWRKKGPLEASPKLLNFDFLLKILIDCLKKLLSR